MKTLLVKMIGVSILSSLFIAGAITGGFDSLSTPEDNVEPLLWNSDPLNYTEPLLTEDEVLLIALDNEEVNRFVEAQNADPSFYYDGYGLWMVSFYPETVLDFLEYLDVYIDDNSSEIIDIVYMTDDFFVEEDPELTEAATEFLTNSELTSNFIIANSEIPLSITGLISNLCIS